MAIQATDFRIGNAVKYKGDAGIYFVAGIDGWRRIFASIEDERLYNASIEKQIKSTKTAQYHDERLIRLAGGARTGEQYIESKIGGIALTPELLIDKCGFSYNDKNKFYWKTWGTNGIVILLYDEHYKAFKIELGKHNYRVLDYLHTLQNGYHFLTCGEELPIKNL